jgi:hypothetical protein
VKNKTIIAQSVVSILALISIAYGRTFSVPDAFSKTYGFPLNWGVHQLVTIAGPVDIWTVNLVNLTIDLVFWLVIIQILNIILEKRSF